MQRYVAIDVDDTVCHFSGVVAHVLSTFTGKSVPYTHWTSHNWYEQYGDHLGLREEVMAKVDYSKLMPTSDKWHTFHKELVELSVTPVYVTARGSVLGQERAGTVTAAWLRQWGIDVADNHVIPVTFNTKKGRLLAELGYDVVASIDDYHNEVIGYVEHFPEAYNVLIDSPINKYRRQLNQEEIAPTYKIDDIDQLRLDVIEHIQNLP